MSLSTAQVARTGRELAANLELSGLTSEEVALALDFAPRRLAETLRVGPASEPADVWLLRDFIDRAVRERAHAPAEWTVLTDRARTEATRWFALTAPPEPPAAD